MFIYINGNSEVSMVTMSIYKRNIELAYFKTVLYIDIRTQLNIVLNEAHPIYNLEDGKLWRICFLLCLRLGDMSNYCFSLCYAELFGFLWC